MRGDSAEHSTVLPPQKTFFLSYLHNIEFSSEYSTLCFIFCSSWKSKACLTFLMIQLCVTFVLILTYPGIEMEIVNSCETNNGGCSHHCEHTTNGPLCSCNHGYRLDQDRKTCIGKNLLSLRCPSICTCLPVSMLSPTLFHCVLSSDTDECVSGESCCTHFCKNYPGGYECSCRTGHTLNPDGCGCDGKNVSSYYFKQAQTRNVIIWLCVFFGQTLMSASWRPQAVNITASIPWEHMSVFVDWASVWMWTNIPACVSWSPNILVFHPSNITGPSNSAARVQLFMAGSRKKKRKRRRRTERMSS